jgi:hypothetical protein
MKSISDIEREKNEGGKKHAASGRHRTYTQSLTQRSVADRIERERERMRKLIIFNIDIE